MRKAATLDSISDRIKSAKKISTETQFFDAIKNIALDLKMFADIEPTRCSELQQQLGEVYCQRFAALASLSTEADSARTFIQHSHDLGVLYGLLQVCTQLQKSRCEQALAPVLTQQPRRFQQAVSAAEDAEEPAQFLHAVRDAWTIAAYINDSGNALDSSIKQRLIVACQSGFLNAVGHAKPEAQDFLVKADIACSLYKILAKHHGAAVQECQTAREDLRELLLTNSQTTSCKSPPAAFCKCLKKLGYPGYADRFTNYCSFAKELAGPIERGQRYQTAEAFYEHTQAQRPTPVGSPDPHVKQQFDLFMQGKVPANRLIELSSDLHRNGFATLGATVDKFIGQMLQVLIDEYCFARNGSTPRRAGEVTQEHISRTKVWTEDTPSVLKRWSEESDGSRFGALMPRGNAVSRRGQPALNVEVDEGSSGSEESVSITPSPESSRSEPSANGSESSSKGDEPTSSGAARPPEPEEIASHGRASEVAARPARASLTGKVAAASQKDLTVKRTEAQRALASLLSTLSADGGVMSFMKKGSSSSSVKSHESAFNAAWLNLDALLVDHQKETEYTTLFADGLDKLDAAQRKRLEAKLDSDKCPVSHDMRGQLLVSLRREKLRELIVGMVRASGHLKARDFAYDRILAAAEQIPRREGRSMHKELADAICRLIEKDELKTGGAYVVGLNSVESLRPFIELIPRVELYKLASAAKESGAPGAELSALIEARILRWGAPSSDELQAPVGELRELRDQLLSRNESVQSEAVRAELSKRWVTTTNAGARLVHESIMCLVQHKQGGDLSTLLLKLKAGSQHFAKGDFAQALKNRIADLSVGERDSLVSALGDPTVADLLKFFGLLKATGPARWAELQEEMIGVGALLRFVAQAAEAKIPHVNKVRPTPAMLKSLSDAFRILMDSNGSIQLMEDAETTLRNIAGSGASRDSFGNAEYHVHLDNAKDGRPTTRVLLAAGETQTKQKEAASSNQLTRAFPGSTEAQLKVLRKIAQTEVVAQVATSYRVALPEGGYATVRVRNASCRFDIGQNKGSTDLFLNCTLSGALSHLLPAGRPPIPLKGSPETPEARYDFAYQVRISAKGEVSVVKPPVPTVRNVVRDEWSAANGRAWLKPTSMHDIFARGSDPGLFREFSESLIVCMPKGSTARAPDSMVRRRVIELIELFNEFDADPTAEKARETVRRASDIVKWAELDSDLWEAIKVSVENLSSDARPEAERPVDIFDAARAAIARRIDARKDNPITRFTGSIAPVTFVDAARLLASRAVDPKLRAEQWAKGRQFLLDQRVDTRTSILPSFEDAMATSDEDAWRAVMENYRNNGGPETFDASMNKFLPIAYARRPQAVAQKLQPTLSKLADAQDAVSAQHAYDALLAECNPFVRPATATATATATAPGAKTDRGAAVKLVLRTLSASSIAPDIANALSFLPEEELAAIEAEAKNIFRPGEALFSLVARAREIRLGASKEAFMRASHKLASQNPSWQDATELAQAVIETAKASARYALHRNSLETKPGPDEEFDRRLDAVKEEATKLRGEDFNPITDDQLVELRQALKQLGSPPVADVTVQARIELANKELTDRLASALVKMGTRDYAEAQRELQTILQQVIAGRQRWKLFDDFAPAKAAAESAIDPLAEVLAMSARVRELAVVGLEDPIFLAVVASMENANLGEHRDAHDFLFLAQRLREAVGIGGDGKTLKPADASAKAPEPSVVNQVLRSQWGLAIDDKRTVAVTGEAPDDVQEGLQLTERASVDARNLNLLSRNSINGNSDNAKRGPKHNQRWFDELSGQVASYYLAKTEGGESALLYDANKQALDAPDARPRAVAALSQWCSTPEQFTAVTTISTSKFARETAQAAFSKNAGVPLRDGATGVPTETDFKLAIKYRKQGLNVYVRYEYEVADPKEVLVDGQLVPLQPGARERFTWEAVVNEQGTVRLAEQPAGRFRFDVDAQPIKEYDSYSAYRKARSDLQALKAGSLGQTSFSDLLAKMHACLDLLDAYARDFDEPHIADPSTERDDLRMMLIELLASGALDEFPALGSSDLASLGTVRARLELDGAAFTSEDVRQRYFLGKAFLALRKNDLAGALKALAQSAPGPAVNADGRAALIKAMLQSPVLDKGAIRAQLEKPEFQAMVETMRAIIGKTQGEPSHAILHQAAIFQVEEIESVRRILAELDGAAVPRTPGKARAALNRNAADAIEKNFDGVKIFRPGAKDEEIFIRVADANGKAEFTGEALVYAKNLLAAPQGTVAGTTVAAGFAASLAARNVYYLGADGTETRLDAANEFQGKDAVEAARTQLAEVLKVTPAELAALSRVSEHIAVALLQGDHTPLRGPDGQLVFLLARTSTSKQVISRAAGGKLQVAITYEQKRATHMVPIKEDRTSTRIPLQQDRSASATPMNSAKIEFVVAIGQDGNADFLGPIINVLTPMGADATSIDRGVGYPMPQEASDIFGPLADKQIFYDMWEYSKTEFSSENFEFLAMIDAFQADPTVEQAALLGRAYFDSSQKAIPIDAGLKSRIEALFESPSNPKLRKKLQGKYAKLLRGLPKTDDENVVALKRALTKYVEQKDPTTAQGLLIWRAFFDSRQVNLKGATAMALAPAVDEGRQLRERAASAASVAQNEQGLTAASAVIGEAQTEIREMIARDTARKFAAWKPPLPRNKGEGLPPRSSNNGPTASWLTRITSPRGQRRSPRSPEESPSQKTPVKPSLPTVETTPQPPKTPKTPTTVLSLRKEPKPSVKSGQGKYSNQVAAIVRGDSDVARNAMAELLAKSVTDAEAGQALRQAYADPDISKIRNDRRLLLEQLAYKLWEADKTPGQQNTSITVAYLAGMYAERTGARSHAPFDALFKERINNQSGVEIETIKVQGQSTQRGIPPPPPRMEYAAHNVNMLDRARDTDEAELIAAASGWERLEFAGRGSVSAFVSGTANSQLGSTFKNMAEQVARKGPGACLAIWINSGTRGYEHWMPLIIANENGVVRAHLLDTNGENQQTGKTVRELIGKALDSIGLKEDVTYFISSPHMQTNTPNACGVLGTMWLNRVDAQMRENYAGGWDEVRKEFVSRWINAPTEQEATVRMERAALLERRANYRVQDYTAATAAAAHAAAGSVPNAEIDSTIQSVLLLAVQGPIQPREWEPMSALANSVDAQKLEKRMKLVLSGVTDNDRLVALDDSQLASVAKHLKPATLEILPGRTEENQMLIDCVNEEMANRKQARSGAAGHRKVAAGVGLRLEIAPPDGDLIPVRDADAAFQKFGNLNFNPEVDPELPPPPPGDPQVSQQVGATAQRPGQFLEVPK